MLFGMCKFNKQTNLDQIVEMQQVVIEDREEEEMLQQLEELGRIAVKVRSTQDPLKRNARIQHVWKFCLMASYKC